MSIKAKDMTPAERKERVAQLVRQFKENETFYLSKNFVESEVRNKFIDPLLECLKWDVKNEKGARHDRQEVITEDRVVMNGQVKHPDSAASGRCMWKQNSRALTLKQIPNLRFRCGGMRIHQRCRLRY